MTEYIGQSTYFTRNQVATPRPKALRIPFSLPTAQIVDLGRGSAVRDDRAISNDTRGQNTLGTCPEN